MANLVLGSVPIVLWDSRYVVLVVCNVCSHDHEYVDDGLGHAKGFWVAFCSFDEHVWVGGG